MAYRDTESDATRRGAAQDQQTKGNHGFQYVMPPPQGKWLPAYSGAAGTGNGGMGKSAMEWDEDQGTAGNEVGNDYDGDYDDRPYPQTT